jgi:eight-cysteine-cluster-containing protein
MNSITNTESEYLSEDFSPVEEVDNTSPEAAPTIPKEVPEVAPVLPVSSGNTKSCKVGGCSSQLCLNADAEEMMTTCEYREEYACYRQTKCEVQASGECGWTENEEFIQCLAVGNLDEV